jgi:hypothetical protein
LQKNIWSDRFSPSRRRTFLCCLNLIVRLALFFLLWSHHYTFFFFLHNKFTLLRVLHVEFWCVWEKILFYLMFSFHISMFFVCNFTYDRDYAF